MKVTIKMVTFDKEVKTKFGSIMFAFLAKYTIPSGEDRSGSFLSKTKENPSFEENKEYEIVETPREYNGKTYYNIKKYKQPNQTGYSKARKAEQSKYSGFATSYVKDLIKAGVIIHESPEEMMSDWKAKSEEMFWFMVELDKKLES